MGSPKSEFRDGMRIDWDVPIEIEWQKSTGARLSNFKNELRGCGPFLHDDPRDRPAAVFGGKAAIHSVPERGSYVLVPVVPKR